MGKIIPNPTKLNKLCNYFDCKINDLLEDKSDLINTKQENKNSMNIGNAIRENRRKAGLSQMELGRLLDVSQAMIAQYENEQRKPKLESIQKIANALSVDVNLLLQGTYNDSLNTRTFQQQDDYENDELNKGYMQSKLSEELIFDNIDIEILKDFHKLNAAGKERIIAYLSDLLKIENYQS